MSRTLQYKDYEGSVLYSSEDRLLHGAILGIRDMVTYDGADIPTLEQNFHAAVDEYLEFCRVEGRSPNKPFKGSLNVRISHDLHLRAARFADEHNLKLNAVINEALQRYLAESA